MCFARIRFQHCHKKLPLFELEWQSFKGGPRQHSLPKVRFAIKSLPEDFSACSERDKPSMPVKSVLAAAFLWQRGRVTWQSTKHFTSFTKYQEWS
jgi:hypothetical protein